MVSEVVGTSGNLCLEGQVVDEHGRPVADARVDLDGGRHARSDEDGRFAFAGLAAVMYRLEARTAERSSDITLVTVRENREPVILKLTFSMSVQIRVLDGEIPVGDARVTIEPDELVGVTDSDGVVVIRGLRSHFHLFAIVADGYAPASVDLLLAMDPSSVIERTIHLQRGAEVSGIVSAPGGAVIPGAVVTLWGSSCSAVKTDSSGRWRFASVAAGSYRITASAIGLAPTSTGLVLDGATPCDQLALRLAAGAQLAGCVVDGAGQPVAHAFIVAMISDDIRAEEILARSDARGRFELLGLAEGRYDIFAHEGRRASPQIELELEGGVRSELRMVVEPASIAGAVIDERGNPVAGARVRAESRFVRGDITDSLGRFDLGAFPPGTYEAAVSWPDQHEQVVPDTVTVATSETTRIVLPTLGSIIGRVLLDGAPMPYFGVMLTTCPCFPWIGRADGVRNSDARFALRGVTPGRWGVVIAGPGTSLLTLQEIELEAGATLDLGDLHLVRGRRVTGHVRDGSGDPVANALVTIGSEDGPSDPLEQWFHRIARTFTDEHGAYAVEGIADVEHLQPQAIAATHATIGTSLSTRLRAGVATIDLVLLETGGIEAVVPPTLDLGSVLIRGTSNALPVRTVRVIGGMFRVDGLPPGDYEVTTFTGNQAGPEPMVVTVTTGRRVNVTLPEA